MTGPRTFLVLGRGAVALLSAFIALPARSQSSPPSRQFGPDTYSIGQFTGQGTATPQGLRCEPPASSPDTPRTCAGYLASDLDGALLEVVVKAPRTGSSFPLLVGIHGWGGSAGSMDDYDAQVTAAGYVYLRYSTRGFGNSWGEVNLADVNVEAADLRSMIAQVVDFEDPNLRIDPSRVAVFGASYGGAHSWLAAIRPTFTTRKGKSVRIRTIVPIVPWTELTSALRPNGRPLEPIEPPGALKLSYTQALYIGGFRDPDDPRWIDRPYSNYPPYLHVWNDYLIATEPNNLPPLGSQIVDGTSGYRSIYWQPEFWSGVVANRVSGAAQIPVFELHGFTDDLFPLDEALRMYRALRAVAPGYPIKLYLGDVGHPRALNEPAEMSYAIGLIFDWLAWHLKGEGAPAAYDVVAAITRPQDRPFSTADVLTVPTYESLATGEVRHPFDGAQVITFNPANTSGFVWDPLLMVGAEQLEPYPCNPAMNPLNPCRPPSSEEVPGNVAVFSVPVEKLAPGAATLLIAGQPSVAFRANVTLGHRVQFNVRLFDVDPDGTRHLITRGTYTVDTGSPLSTIGETMVTVPTYGNLWEAAAGDVIRVEITNSDSPYLSPSRVPSETEISGVELRLPVRQNAAVAVTAAAATARTAESGAADDAPADYLLAQDYPTSPHAASPALSRVGGGDAGARSAAVAADRGMVARYIREQGITALRFAIPSLASRTRAGGAGAGSAPGGSAADEVPVQIRIFDAGGRLVRVAVSDRLAPGHYRYQWDGRDAGGRALAPGVYVAVMSAPAFTRTTKLVIVR